MTWSLFKLKTERLYHGGIWRWTFWMHKRLPHLQTLRSSPALWMFTMLTQKLISKWYASTTWNSRLQCSLDKFTFRAWLNRNHGLFSRKLQWHNLDIKTWSLPRAQPPPTALLGSQHSAWCISQVQIKPKLRSEDLAASSVEHDLRKKRFHSNLDGYCTGWTPKLHTFGIEMPECSKEKKVTWVSHKNLKTQKKMHIKKVWQILYKNLHKKACVPPGWVDRCC